MSQLRRTHPRHTHLHTHRRDAQYGPPPPVPQKPRHMGYYTHQHIARPRVSPIPPAYITSYSAGIASLPAHHNPPRADFRTRLETRRGAVCYFPTDLMESDPPS